MADCREKRLRAAQAPGDGRAVLALPRGRLLGETIPLLRRAGITPQAGLEDDSYRQLHFTTNIKDLSIIRVRAFDAATFIAFGVADVGVVGSDVLTEFDYPELYMPLDLGIGHCRMVVAATADVARNEDLERWSHIRVATKYPQTSRRYFAARGIHAECVKLHGAVEVATRLGLCPHIVDLISTGATLRDNGLVEVESIADITARLVVNRTSLKTKPALIERLVRRFAEATAKPPAPHTPASSGGKATPSSHARHAA